MSSAFAKSVNRRVLLAVGMASSSLIGCMAEVREEPAYAEVEYVPADLEVYPHTVYAGETVYLVGDRWYYRRGPHWVYYTHEPPDLVRYRAHVERAPRAPRREYHRYERAAPPAHKREYDERGAKRGYYVPRAHPHSHDRRSERHDARRHGPP